MSGSRPTVAIRVSAEGADLARAKMEALGSSGEAALRRVSTASAAASPGLQRLAGVSDAANQAFTGMGGSLGRIGAVASGVSGAAGLLTTGFLALGAAATIGATAIAKAGDEATGTLARLTSATGSLSQARDVYEGLFRLSQQTGVAVAESAGAFSRFAIAAKEIGGTNDQVLKLVSGIQKAGIVAGASAEETSSAVTQIGQALASGVLQGDELRSVLENMPNLAQALARELGVNIGQLRQMGADGKLSSEVVFPALLRASERMNAEFEKMPPTMGRAFSILGESMTRFAADLDRALGLSQGIAAAAKAAADAVNGVRRIVSPNEREQADDAVASATATLERVRAQIAADRAASAYGAVSPGLAQAERIAEDQLREALARQQSIRREDQEMQRAEAADAAQRAAEARRTRLGIEVRDVAEFADKRLKIARETAEKLRLIDQAEAAGVTRLQGSPGVPGAPFDAAKARAGVLREQAEALEKLAKEEAKAGEEAFKAGEKRRQVTDALGLQIDAERAAIAALQTGTTASREAIVALETEAKVREAGIPAIEKRTEAQKRDAAAIGDLVKQLDDLKQAHKKAEEAAKTAKQWHDRSWNELASIGERAFDRLGDAIVNAFVSGQGAAVNFGNIARGILSSVVADVAKLAVVNPILNSLFTSTSGPRPTLSGAFGGSSAGSLGLGDLFGLGNLLPGGGIGGLFSGVGSGITSSIFGTAGGSFADLGGITVAGQPGLFGLGGQTLFGGAVPSLGGMLGGIGAGFGLGNMLGGLIATSPARQQNAMIGSALGSLIGSIGGPIGSVIGGLIGGAGGGLIGPPPKSNGWSFAVRGNGEGLGAGVGSQLLMTDKYYNEQGAQYFQQAEQAVAAINAYLKENSLTVAGARAVGGNKDGMGNLGYGEAASLGEALASLRFGSTKDSRLDTYLAGQTFDDPAKLQAAVEGFNQAAAAVDALGAEAVPAFTASLKAVNDNFDAGVEAAKKYGLAEDNLTTAREKAIAALHAQRTETLRQTGAGLDIRLLAAQGDTQGAELLRQAEAARLETEAFTASLDQLAASAEERAAVLVKLEEVQAAERAAIIARFGEQAAQALRTDLDAGRNLLRELTFGTSSALAPEQKYFAALTTLNQAKQELDAGGSLAAYSAIASQVLPVARDYLGTSQRYAGLAAEVGQVLASKGADSAGLSSILSAQVDGMSDMQTTFAAYGDLQVNALKGLRADFQRLAATVEALITRRSAA